jgi:hypothetical protein
MATRLSSLLVQDGLVGVKRMEEAFQRQVIYGGSLDTILLEMRVIDERRLVGGLERATGLAAADLAEVLRPDAEALRLCRQDLAQGVGIAPLALRDGVLRVLVVDPVDRARLDELGFQLGVGVEPRIAAECRLYQAWSLHYGTPLPARYATLLARLAAPEEGRAAAARSAPAAPPAAPEPRAAAPAPPAAGPEASPLSMEAAAERITNARNRDEIFDAFVRAARSRLEYAALFTIQGTHAHGRVALSRDGSQDLSAVSLRLDGESALAAAARSGAPYLGPPGADLANDACFAALGRPRPTTILLVPAVIRGRTVALLYGDRGQRSIPAAQVVDLFTLGHEVGRAFSRLIMRAKGAAYSPATGTAGALDAPAPPPSAAPAAPWEPAAATDAARWRRSTTLMGIAPPAEAPAAEAAAAPPAPTPVTTLVGIAPPPALAAPAAAAPEPAPPAVIEPVSPFPLAVEAPSPVEVAPPPAVAAVAEYAPEPVSPFPLAADAPPRPAAADPFAAAAEPAVEGVVPEPLGDGVPEAPLDGADTAPMAAADPWSHPSSVVELDAEPPPPPPPPAPAEEGGLELMAELPSGPVPLAPDALHWLNGPGGGAALPVGTGVTVVSTREIEALLDEIERAPQSAEAHLAAAALERMGEPALEVLVRRFPGRLRCDRYASQSKLPPVGEHSELLRLLIDFGRPAVRHVLPLLGAADLDVRFYATYLFSELVFAEVVPAVATRLYDPDHSIRAVAVEVLRRYGATAEMREVLERARGELPGPDPQRQRYAAQALGELRDIPSVPRLIELVRHRDEAIAEAARRALITITKQDHGASARQWRAWWEKNRTRHRVEWLLEGLGHGTAEIRLAASEELRRLTNEHFGYHFDLPKREREEARQRWVAWWERTGRKTVGGERV